MSNREQAEEEQHNQQLLNNLRKASDSTLEMAEYLKEEKQSQSHPEEQEEQYDQINMNELSSGVYKIQSNEEGKEGDEDEDEIGQKNKKQIERKRETHQKDKESPREEEIVSEEETQEMYPNISKKEKKEQQQQHKQEPQLQQSQKQQDETHFQYPSLMEQSTLDAQQTNLNPSQRPNTQSIQYSPKEVPSYPRQVIKKIEVIVPSQQSQSRPQLQHIVKSQLQKLKHNSQSQQPTSNEQPLIELQKEHPTVENTNSLAYRLLPRLEEIPMEESQKRPKLEPVQEKPSRTELRIIGYEKQYFLSIETQVYQIQYNSPHKNYIFCRKYSDFVALDKMIKKQYPGFILYPFPQNSLALFKTLKLPTGNELNKVIIIEKRLYQLEKYINFLLSHRQLSHSQIFEVFLAESKELFTKQFSVLEMAVDKAEQQYSESTLTQNYNQIKNLVKSGISFLNNYISNPPPPQNATLLIEVQRKAEQSLKSFTEITSEVIKDSQLYSNFQIKMEKLIEIYQYHQLQKPIQSSIDSVLKFCTKNASSKNYYEQLEHWINDRPIDRIKHYVSTLAQVETLINYRNKLLERACLLNIDQIKVAVALIERAEEFDNRFKEDWTVLHQQLNQEYQLLVKEFREKYQEHCQLMTKIWK